MKYLIAYLVIINAWGFVSMLIDKQKAIKKKWRTPERYLMSTAVSGGSLGILAGMLLFRHKTKHLKFTIGVPIILAVQIVIIVLKLSWT